MTFDPTDAIQAIFDESVSAHRRFVAHGMGDILAAAAAISRATASGHKVLAFGNGGSASDAQHFVAELVG